MAKVEFGPVWEEIDNGSWDGRGLRDWIFIAQTALTRKDGQLQALRSLILPRFMNIVILGSAATCLAHLYHTAQIPHGREFGISEFDMVDAQFHPQIESSTRPRSTSQVRRHDSPVFSPCSTQPDKEVKVKLGLDNLSFEIEYA